MTVKCTHLSSTPTISGVGASGSSIKLFQRASSSTSDGDYVEIGTTTVGSGETAWSITTNPLSDGEYSFAAEARVSGTTTPKVPYANTVVIDTVAPSISRVVGVGPMLLRQSISDGLNQAFSISNTTITC